MVEEGTEEIYQGHTHIHIPGESIIILYWLSAWLVGKNANMCLLYSYRDHALSTTST